MSANLTIVQMRQIRIKQITTRTALATLATLILATWRNTVITKCWNTKKVKQEKIEKEEKSVKHQKSLPWMEIAAATAAAVVVVAAIIAGKVYRRKTKSL